MENGTQDLSERLLDFGAEVVKFTMELNRTYAGRHIGMQLIRSATSCGANYEEACAAESKADFVHKMQIVLKELRESLYWLKLVRKAGVADNHLQPLLGEADELAKIFAKSIVTARGHRE